MSAEVLGSGKVAVVTGGGSGIGRSLCERFAARGLSVVVADIDTAAGESTAAALCEGGGNAAFVHVDVADLASVEALAETALATYGSVDVLCNNAGVSTFNLMADQTIDDWRWVLDVDLWGVIHGVQTFVPIMRAQESRGHVINTASMGGLMSGVAFIAPYAAAKAAVVSISETMAAEFEIDGTNIGVGVLCPGSTDTNVMESERSRPESIDPEVRTEMAESVRLMIKGMFTSDVGKSAGDVADDVVTAIETDRFWIITHPFERPIIEKRAAEILASFPDTAN